MEYIKHKRRKPDKEHRYLDDEWINFNHLEEYYCDEIAADILGTTEEEKKAIIKQGINFFQKNINQYGNNPSYSHPRSSKRIDRLQQQLALIEKHNE